MIAKYNKLSFVWAIPGLIIQVVGGLIENPLIQLVGAGFVIVGLSYYAMAKGRTPAWGLMGILSIVGLIVLACLKDLDKSEQK